mgnify:CR=1 FL=1
MFSYVKSVTNQVFHGNQKGGASALEANKYKAAEEAKKKAEKDKLLANLFKNA